MGVRAAAGPFGTQAALCRVGCQQRRGRPRAASPVKRWWECLLRREGGPDARGSANIAIVNFVASGNHAAAFDPERQGHLIPPSPASAEPTPQPGRTPDTPAALSLSSASLGQQGSCRARVADHPPRRVRARMAGRILAARPAPRCCARDSGDRTIGPDVTEREKLQGGTHALVASRGPAVGRFRRRPGRTVGFSCRLVRPLPQHGAGRQPIDCRRLSDPKGECRPRARAGRPLSRDQHSLLRAVGRRQGSRPPGRCQRCR